MKTRFYVEAHIPRGSGDAEYRIIHPGTGLVVAIVDPNMNFDDPATLADRICDALNVNPEAIA